MQLDLVTDLCSEVVVTGRNTSESTGILYGLAGGQISLKQREQLSAKSEDGGMGTAVLKGHSEDSGAARAPGGQDHHTINGLMHSVDCPESLQKMRW